VVGDVQGQGSGGGTDKEGGRRYAVDCEQRTQLSDKWCLLVGGPVLPRAMAGHGDEHTGLRRAILADKPRFLQVALGVLCPDMPTKE
jgi:hypothetical protein